MEEPDVSLSTDSYSRLDEDDDRIFYARDRFVSHLDSVALETIENLIGQLVIEEHPAVLDLMASWDSHIPSTLRPTEVVGLGLNQNELSRNRALTSSVIHDLNREPRLPFSDRRFDVVLCTVSVDYLTRPVAVFRDVGRVLKPGGLFLVTFSNRFFPPKVVKIWREATDLERLNLVRGYFRRSGSFDETAILVSKGQPRPNDDRYAGLGLPSDPVLAVYAERSGGAGRIRPQPIVPGVTAPPASGEYARRKAAVADTLRCPHCDRTLERWKVPYTPFTQWSSEHQYICFNDHCPYYSRGWAALAGQGNPGSYRFMFDPDSGGCHSIPVLTPQSLRESIDRKGEGDEGSG